MLNEAYIEGVEAGFEELEKIAGAEFVEKVAKKVDPSLLEKIKGGAKTVGGKVKGHFMGGVKDIKKGVTGKYTRTIAPPKGAKGKGKTVVTEISGPVRRKLLRRGAGRLAPYAAGAGAAGGAGYYAAKD